MDLDPPVINLAKIKLEDIKEELAKKDWQVLSEKYENLDAEMVFKCPEGHSINTTWKKLRDHIECPICTKIGFKDYGDKIVAKPRGVKRILALD